MTMLPLLQRGLREPDERSREGAALGLSAVLANANKALLAAHLRDVIPAVREALCDPSAPRPVAHCVHDWALLHHGPITFPAGWIKFRCVCDAKPSDCSFLALAKHDGFQLLLNALKHFCFLWELFNVLVTHQFKWCVL